MIEFYLDDVKNFTFNGGEINVNVSYIEDSDEYTIIANIRNSEDVMKLFMLTNALRKKYNKIERTPLINLYIPYFPYARQDRVCNKGEAFSLEVFVSLLRSQNYYYITTLDPHSDVLKKIMPEIIIEKPFENIKKMFLDIGGNEFNLVIPDKGAIERAKDIINHFIDIKFNVVQFNKNRDLSTGKIINMNKLLDNSDDNIPYILIDDICDGGRTFLEIGKLLNFKNLLEKTYLFVTHGIFSGEWNKLLEYYDTIYTTDSFYNRKIDRIKVV